MRKMTQAQVDDWNDWYPVGSPCILVSNHGEVQTRTRSIAWLVGHGQAVVKVEGKTGGWELDRIKMMNTVKLEAQ